MASAILTADLSTLFTSDGDQIFATSLVNIQCTDQTVMESIQYTVIEPPDLGATWPSGLWSQSEVINYINQRQNKFLKDTQLQFGIAVQPVNIGQGTYDLPDDWITSLRCVYINTAGASKELPRSDTWEADYGMPNWTQANGTPKIFYDGGKPISLELIPAPDAGGTIQLHYVPYGALLDGSGELMTVPCEFVPSIKYGVIADMLTKVGRANDAPRAEYCANRFSLGVDIARLLVKGFN